jgi:hypothetical protein
MDSVLREDWIHHGNHKACWVCNSCLGEMKRESSSCARFAPKSTTVSYCVNLKKRIVTFM